MRVLLVEDLPSVAAELAASIADVGVEVDVASNAAEAIAQINARQHDFVICDLRIPASLESLEALNQHGTRVLDHIADVAHGLARSTQTRM